MIGLSNIQGDQKAGKSKMYIGVVLNSKNRTRISN